MTPLFGSLPKIDFTTSCTAGILDIPPTSNTSSISLAESLASAKAFWHGAFVRSMRLDASFSKWARVSVKVKCLGPLASIVMNGWLISVEDMPESSIFAFSAASLSL
ncbi:Uncharacterised protein [Chlamydia abortus]|nr:Uncharacterised protein [Chlamydia abortus]